MGLKTQINLDWAEVPQEIWVSPEKTSKFYTSSTKYGAFLATTAYWICPLAQIAFVRKLYYVWNILQR